MHLIKLMNTLYSPPNGSNVEEIETIKQLKKLISKAENKELQISTSNGESIALPNSVTDIFRTVINVIAQGKGISLIPVAEEVTTTQGAEILNISRPYLMRLIENGEIPYHQVGTHKRINLQDLLEYKKIRDTKRKKGLQKLTELSQELGLYDIDYSSIELE